MRTALITVGDKQQVVLQPENKREHRILQMLLDGTKDVHVAQTDVEVTAEGSLAMREKPLYYSDKEQLEAVMIQVQPAAPIVMKAPPERNPDVLVMTHGELEHALAMKLGRKSDVYPFDQNDKSREVLKKAHKDYIELIAALDKLREENTEPHPYLAQ